MDFSEARALFQSLAHSRGIEVLCGDQSAELESGFVRLRKTHHGVILEITNGPLDHGPADGAAIGWLELFSDDSEIREPALAECIDYALDLCVKK